MELNKAHYDNDKNRYPEDTCSFNHYSAGENKATHDQTNSTYSSLKTPRFTIKAVIADNSHGTHGTANDSKQISVEIYLRQTKASQLRRFKVNTPPSPTHFFLFIPS